MVHGDSHAGCQVGEEGEDLSFCWKAKKLGFKIYAGPTGVPGHLGVYAYGVWDHETVCRGSEGAGTFPEIENASQRRTTRTGP